MTPILLTLIAIAAAAAVGAAVVRYFREFRPDRTMPTMPDGSGDLGPVFLFRGDDLIDATAGAQQLIAPFADLSDRDALLQALGPQFPTLAGNLENGPNTYTLVPHYTDPQIWIDLDWPCGQLRVKVRGALPSVADESNTAELTLLRDITFLTPQLIWRTDSDGSVTWANQAYLAFWDRLNTDNLCVLAQKSLFPSMGGPAKLGTPGLRRVAIKSDERGTEFWFDVATVVQDQAHLHFATDANSAVRADQDRRNFVQTLGKTFAELAIGLAIFDKRRQLATFNPALLDMTRLGFDFLSSRPTIDTVLDRLRETRILPEPKDYASWRDQFTAVETAAKNGTYSEVWNLPDGQAFRVTGRPHPDGAFAFLFEDITADLSLTRRFRLDIETGQAVLDALPDAVAVFSNAGTLVMYNRAYMLLWGIDVESGLEHRALGSELTIWQSRCIETGTWDDLTQFMHQHGPRKHWTDDALLSDGRLLRCHASPIAGGMTMVRFALAVSGLPSLRKVVAVEPTVHAGIR